MDHTVEALRKLGLVQESDLVTYRELYPAPEAVTEGRLPADVPATYEVPTQMVGITAVG